MNSKVLPFIIVAGLVLIGAVIWNLTASNNEPEIVSNVKTEKIEVVETKPEPKEVYVEDIVIEDYDQPKNKQPLTQEEIDAQHEKASNLMSFALQYQTEEKAIEGFKALKKSGNEKAAKDLLEFIKMTYPNAKISSDLLD